MVDYRKLLKDAIRGSVMNVDSIPVPMPHFDDLKNEEPPRYSEEEWKAYLDCIEEVSNEQASIDLPMQGAIDRFDAELKADELAANA